MLEAIGAVLFALFSSAALQSPYLYHPRPAPGVFNPPSKSIVYVDDGVIGEGQTRAPVCLEYCNQKGESQ